MAKRPTINPKEVLHPNFFIPDGTEEFVHDEFDPNSIADESDVEGVYLEDAFAVDETDGFLEVEDEYGLDVPDNVTIISQTLRRSPGGVQVIDVVIDVEDVPGALHYEIRKA